MPTTPRPSPRARNLAAHGPVAGERPRSTPPTALATGLPAIDRRQLDRWENEGGALAAVVATGRRPGLGGGAA